ncbi:helix-turn-helix domain-containing protein [Tessaracoccus palaemonis]|uniref:Helix-turn-helix transcriptional regulator n=1 Tax=Tessaracoccus palaemonis TaxID=2829499 RepID=A0ABX8SJH3_9ACTN|nr:helix-turn-helix transcriptional regulator [Tessaracoccus palaemonis]QXT63473.1 helix-turn-helix transcriptional regulator [Tessaracoccus palaemonis]
MGVTQRACHPAGRRDYHVAMPSSDAARAAIREFLVSRREHLAPGDVGIAVHTGRRKVKGLRREEVALFAGISTEYYIRFERGDATGASPSVVNAIARALRLNDIELQHLKELLAVAETVVPTVKTVTQRLRPALQRLIDGMVDVPVIVTNGHHDVLGTNRLGRALYAPMFDDNGAANTSRFFFLREAEAREFWPEWEKHADDAVAIMRADVGARPFDAELRALADELLANSPAFAERWKEHNVHRHRTGVKIIQHPAVGRLELPFENLAMPGDPDLSMMIYNPVPGSASYDGIRLLGSLSRGAADHSPGARSTAD